MVPSIETTSETNGVGIAAGDELGDECGGAGVCIGHWECAGPNLAECGGCE